MQYLASLPNNNTRTNPLCNTRTNPLCENNHRTPNRLRQNNEQRAAHEPSLPNNDTNPLVTIATKPELSQSKQRTAISARYISAKQHNGQILFPNIATSARISLPKNLCRARIALDKTMTQRRMGLAQTTTRFPKSKAKHDIGPDRLNQTLLFITEFALLIRSLYPGSSHSRNPYKTGLHPC